MGLLQKIQAFLHIGGQKSSASPTFQQAINAAGSVVDEGEALFDKFVPLEGVLPEPYKALVVDFGLALHALDSYLDKLETPANPTPAPAPAPVAHS